MSFCTQADIEHLLSQEGVLLSSGDTGEETIVDADTITSVIERAEQKFLQYVVKRYDATVLAGNVSAKWAVATIAAKYLRQRRGETAPDGLSNLYDETIAWLESIQEGEGQIPGVGVRTEPGLSMSNMIIDPRYRTAKVRVTQQISAGSQTSTKPRRPDYTSWMPELYP